MTVGFAARLSQAKQALDPSDPVWQFNSKLAGRRFARSLGIRVPELLAVVDTLDRLRPPDAEAFVIKPNDGHGSRVIPLIRERRRFWSLLGHGLLTWNEVVALAGRMEARDDGKTHPDRIRGPWLIETPVSVPLPYDWKFYTFRGKTELIRQRDTRGSRKPGRWRFRWWTPQWDDAGNLQPGKITVGRDLPAPKHPVLLTETASVISAALDVPFVRVDLYEDGDGPVFGELTPHPGGRCLMVPEWDLRLGQAWRP